MSLSLKHVTTAVQTLTVLAFQVFVISYTAAAYLTRK